MNFLSGMFVLIFGIGMTQEALHYFRDSKTSDEDTKTSLAFGWTGMLLWLTSGMGAFLVFVDNKTDLGVLAMTILALLSGFIFLRVVHTNHQSENKLHKDALKYVVISGFMFSLASLSKPTAFIDIALFGLLVVALWIDQIIALGLGFLIL
jgi:4-amino-4-deoxy-L-arabinose transferase-like glycosyltransferase